MHNRHLNGWKEIGSYLGRSVRTAQRWEAQLEMPVHRPAKGKKAVVVAFPRDLDIWLVRNRSCIECYASYETTDSTTEIAMLSEKLVRLQAETTQLALEIQRARGEVAQFPQTGSTNLVAYPEHPD